MEPLLPQLLSPWLSVVLTGGTHCFVNYALGTRWTGFPVQMPWFGYSECPAADLQALPPPLGIGAMSGPQQEARGAAAQLSPQAPR